MLPGCDRLPRRSQAREGRRPTYDAPPRIWIAYVLSGSLIREVDGQPPTPMKAGDSAYIPAKVMHETKNTSTTEPLKLLVVRIHEKGEPVTHRVTAPYFWQ